MSIREWLAEQAALARLAEPRRPLTMADLRVSTAETRFQDAVAKIVARFPTGDDPTSARYQAHSFIQETEIGELFLKRQDAEDLAQHRHLTKRRSKGGADVGGKSNKAIADLWKKAATPTYRELRAKFPKDSANDLAKRITGKVSGLPGDTTVARWVSEMNKKRRSPA
jgi:hypothetical protein